jgi:hypothetical protein
MQELARVLGTIENEAIERGGAPASLRGVTGRMADAAFANHVHGDILDLHPRDIYLTIVKGARAGKSTGAIAAELESKL